MPKFTLPIASLIQGVSQQDDSVRLPGQGTLMDNAWVSPTDGLTQRHPIDHITKIDEDDLGDALIHTINRSADEQYVTLIGGDPGEEFIRVFETDGTEVPVFGPRSLGPPYTPDFDYLQSVSPFRPANKYLKALTLVDYTLILNRNIGVELTHDVTDPDPSETTGFLFVRAGQYTTDYKATLKLTGQDPAEFSVKTWDGVSVGTSTAEVWKLTITAPGTAGTTWSVATGTRFVAASYTVQLGDTASLVANGLAIQINALPGISASAVGAVITITGDNAGVHFVPGVTPATNGTFTLEQTATGDTSEILTSIDTKDIATVLGQQIAADPRFTVDVVGSVIRVDAVATTNPNEIWSIQITKKSAPGTIWTVNVLSQTATYTVQGGDTAVDIAEGLAAAIDALTSVAADSTGTVIRLTSTSEMFPIVTPGGSGQATTTEVADVGTTEGTFESFKAEDSRGDNALLAVWHVVKAIDLLPLVLSDGFIVRIDGGTTEPQDDLYVKFVSDSPGEFGKGRWIEAAGFNVPDTLDQDTMPHALIRRQDDLTGTVTGTPLAKYFEFGPIEWGTRTIGDEDTAPHPSIAKVAIEDDLEGTPEPIQDLFFFRNRLGFIQGQKVLMSQAGIYFNFWRTTVQTVEDDDPIDILVPHHTAINLAHAVAYNQTLVLLSDRVNFVLDGQPLLTPSTVQVSPILEYEHDRGSDPITVAQGIYFPVVRGDFTGVRQMVADPQVVKQFQVDDVTVAVPQYIAGRVIQFATNELEGVLATLASEDQSKLYVLKTFVAGGARYQVAWGQWDLGQNARIMGLGFIGTTLYLVVARPDGTHLEAMTIVSKRVDPGSLYLTRLDRRLDNPDSAYDPDSDRTSWLLPYDPDTDEEYVAVTKSPNGNDGGDIIPLTLDGGALVSAAGDQTGLDVWIGQRFTFRYRFSRVYVRAGDPNVGKQHVQANGRLTVVHGVVRVQDTARFTVETTPVLRSTEAFEYTSADATHYVPGNLPLMTEEIRFGVAARDAQIDLTTSSPLPVKFQSADFECTYDLIAYPPYRG